MEIIKQPRPKRLSGETLKYSSGCGNIYITVNKDSDKIFEVFATLGKAGGCASGQLEAITRCVSLGLRCGIPPQEFIDELEKIRCPNQIEGTLSCPDAIATALREVKDKNAVANIVP